MAKQTQRVYKKYAFKGYSAEFPKLFEKEKALLKKIFPQNTEIEHVGSTAVPGLGGKGVIDIAVLFPKIKNPDKYTKKLEKIGFEFSERHPAHDKRIFMQKIVKNEKKERRVNLHICLTDEFWDSFIKFRDYLRRNKKTRDEYAKIKKRASRLANEDPHRYYQHKEEFIVKNAKRALSGK